MQEFWSARVRNQDICGIGLTLFPVSPVNLFRSILNNTSPLQWVLLLRLVTRLRSNNISLSIQMQR